MTKEDFEVIEEGSGPLCSAFFIRYATGSTNLWEDRGPHTHLVSNSPPPLEWGNEQLTQRILPRGRNPAPFLAGPALVQETPAISGHPAMLSESAGSPGAV